MALMSGSAEAAGAAASAGQSGRSCHAETAMIEKAATVATAAAVRPRLKVLEFFGVISTFSLQNQIQKK